MERYPLRASTRHGAHCAYLFPARHDSSVERMIEGAVRYVPTQEARRLAHSTTSPAVWTAELDQS